MDCNMCRNILTWWWHTDLNPCCWLNGKPTVAQLLRYRSGLDKSRLDTDHIGLVQRDRVHIVASAKPLNAKKYTRPPVLRRVWHKIYIFLIDQNCVLYVDLYALIIYLMCYSFICIVWFCSSFMCLSPTAKKERRHGEIYIYIFHLIMRQVKLVPPIIRRRIPCNLCRCKWM